MSNQIMFVHFTNADISKEDIINGNYDLPFHVTTDTTRGANYGYKAHYFILETTPPDVDQTHVGFNNTGTTNSKTLGMIEWRIKTPAQLRKFLNSCVKRGVSDCYNVDKLISTLSEEEQEFYKGKVNVIPERSKRKLKF